MKLFASLLRLGVSEKELHHLPLEGFDQRKAHWKVAQFFVFSFFLCFLFFRKHGHFLWVLCLVFAFKLGGFPVFP